jgi:hypothetical protein
MLTFDGGVLDLFSAVGAVFHEELWFVMLAYGSGVYQTQSIGRLQAQVPLLLRSV